MATGIFLYRKTLNSSRQTENEKEEKCAKQAHLPMGYLAVLLPAKEEEVGAYVMPQAGEQGRVRGVG